MINSFKYPNNSKQNINILKNKVGLQFDIFQSRWYNFDTDAFVDSTKFSKYEYVTKMKEPKKIERTNPTIFQKCER